MNYQQNVKHILATCIISVLQALAWLLDRLTQEKQFFREVRKCCKENRLPTNFERIVVHNVHLIQPKIDEGVAGYIGHCQHVTGGVNQLLHFRKSKQSTLYKH